MRQELLPVKVSVPLAGCFLVGFTVSDIQPFLCSGYAR
jgi:hypothetical protein